MQHSHDQDHQVEHELERAKLFRELSYGVLAFAFYTALVLLNQDGVLSFPDWMMWETPALEAKAITFLAGFVLLQEKAKEIELDAGHDPRGF